MPAVDGAPNRKMPVDVYSEPASLPRVVAIRIEDFMAAVQQELSWWPCSPVPDWLKTQINADPQCSVTESLIDEKFRAQEADIDFTLVQEIKE